MRAIRDGRWRDLSDVLVAQVALARAQLQLRTRPEGALIDPIAAPDVTSRTPALHHEQAERFARAVIRAARYGVLRPQCLVRALALQQLLERRAITGSAVRIGVRR